MRVPPVKAYHRRTAFIFGVVRGGDFPTIAKGDDDGGRCGAKGADDAEVSSDFLLGTYGFLAEDSLEPGNFALMQKAPAPDSGRNMFPAQSFHMPVGLFVYIDVNINGIDINLSAVIIYLYVSFCIFCLTLLWR